MTTLAICCIIYINTHNGLKVKMAKRYRKEHTISIAITLPMKQHITKAAENSGLRISRFISNIIEKEIGKPVEETTDPTPPQK